MQTKKTTCLNSKRHRTVVKYGLLRHATLNDLDGGISRGDRPPYGQDGDQFERLCDSCKSYR